MSFRVVNGNTHTENGWRCCNRDECDIVRIPGLYMTETAPIRKGAPLIILGAWLFWYDRNVEEILTSIWGWSATNDVLGQPGRNNGSNHLSGTAVDINAPKYPWGYKTMPADRIAKVEEGLRLFEGSVFWGRRWNKPDEMHYQMAWREGDPRNDAFAQKLLNGYLGIYKSENWAPAYNQLTGEEFPMATADDVNRQLDGPDKVKLYEGTAIPEGQPGGSWTTGRARDWWKTLAWDLLRVMPGVDHDRNGDGKSGLLGLRDSVRRIVFEVTLWTPRRTLSQLKAKRGGRDTVHGHALDAASYGDVNHRILERIAQKLDVDISDID